MKLRIFLNFFPIFKKKSIARKKNVTIIFRLQPYYKNFNKRLVKTPKLYFTDSGIVCQLLGIESAEHLQFHVSRGAIFEGFVLTEMYKLLFAKAKRPNLYFWRDHLGVEIDGLREMGNHLQAIEIKASTTVLEDFFQNLFRWQKISEESAKHCYLIYAGDSKMQRKEISILPWNEIIQFPL